MKKISIVIPVFNEEKTISRIIKKIENVELPEAEKEIILVDDKSTDQSRQILEDLKDKHKVIFREVNGGKGAALRDGFKQASGDYLIIQDADLEYDPDEYPLLLEPIINGEADVVYGSRFMGHRPHRVLYFWHYLGNRLLTLFSNMLTNVNLTDMETCYKVFNRRSYEYLRDRISSNRFGIEPEITALVAKNKELRIYEVGISYFGRTYLEGKKINWKDGVAAFWFIIKYNLLRK